MHGYIFPFLCQALILPIELQVEVILSCFHATSRVDMSQFNRCRAKKAFALTASITAYAYMTSVVKSLTA